jgi:PhnB protein
MKAFLPYLTFSGNCEEALKFYSRCFSGEIVYIQYYDEAAAFGNEHLESRVMHSEFAAGPIHLMACDRSSPDSEDSPSRQTLYLTFQTRDKQKQVFESLSEGAKVHMPLQLTVWGSIVSFITDRFGISWMLVYNDEESL